MSSIDPRTPEGVAKIARLSRLALDAQELSALGEHMSKILGWVDELNELDTEGVSASQHEQASEARRADVAAASLPVGEALANAPAKNTMGFLVPPILAE